MARGGEEGKTTNLSMNVTGNVDDRLRMEVDELTKERFVASFTRRL